jgi:hypothetical protein
MYGSPRQLLRLGQTVDGPAENIEHARKNTPADGGHERAAGIFNLHSAGKTLGRGQGDPADPVSIELGHDLNSNPACLSGIQQGRERRQPNFESHIDDTALHRDDYAGVRHWDCLTLHSDNHMAAKCFSLSFRAVARNLAL